ncbi:Holliday junction resolvase RecU [Bacillus coagulans]|nr:Holliday junction resolvase RecU [Heyndrickxia coagulans]
MYTGNRGMAFEATINLVNQLYKSRKIAIINKRPTPVKVLKSKGTKVLSGYFEEKSTVDYDGVYRGRPIYFEAKSVQTVTRFDLSNLHQHQYEYLNLVDQNGALAFVLIEFKDSKDVFLCPMSMVRKYVKLSATGGRKSIPREAFEYEALLVKDTGRAPMDYLACVDQMIESIRERPGMLAE